MPARVVGAVEAVPAVLELTDAVILHIASFLCAKDLLRLQLTARRFAVRVGCPSDPEASAPEMRSVTAEAARCRVAAHTAEQRAWVPRRDRESWLALAWELEQLRLHPPASFSRATTNNAISLSDNGSEASLVLHTHDAYRWRCAASEVTMRGGRHYAEFTVLSGQPHPDNLFGVINQASRPGWAAVGGGAAPAGREQQKSGMSCFYATIDGECSMLPPPGPASDGATPTGPPPRWKGQQTATLNERVGLLLDLEQGSMTVFKEGDLMGVMMASGLSGEYCWAAGLYETGDRVRIESRPVPAAATIS